MKTVDKMTKEELLAEVKRREKKEEEDEDRIQQKIAPLEAKFELALNETTREMNSLNKEYIKLEAKAKAIAEKYGVPIEFNSARYMPKNITKWQDKKKYSEVELNYFMEHNVYSSGYFYGMEPGDFWVPSSC